ncbi:atrial natriuretic peptide receptor 2-like [Cydia fagiglandana]|uniref:atrial natriuretic peptide receptor 2-like n=1 Tax=Cydia fagiglandana TaxID=1458189 RepID=UPI002FEE65D0
MLQLSASYELVRAREKLSRAHSDLQYLTVEEIDAATARVTGNLASGVEHLDAAVQYLKADHLEYEEVQTIIDYYTTSFFINDTVQMPDIKSNDGPNYAKDSKTCLDMLRRFQYGFRSVIRTSVQHEVWTARRTLGVGVGIFVALLIATPVLVLMLRNTITTMQGFSSSIATTTQRLMAEKQKSDLLLSKMLPMPVLQRLRAQKTVPAEAFDAVTIFFSDIVGFTSISANSTPMEIINMLNMLYRLFDEKITQYNVYKVETIGDAYMAVSGLPQRNGNKHASEIADMSLSLMRALDGATVPHCPGEALKIRAGVNTGPCVAGVVGTCMPRYCLFGDTINTASRMESTGEAMKIHISDTTKIALDLIGGYEVESRGIKDIPGKGQMETFWLVGKLAGLQIESPCGPRLKDYDQDFIEMLIS